MIDLFVYGTLRHVPLLECVLGRSAASLAVREGELLDWAAFWVKDEIFPMIQPQSGARATGLHIPDLSEADLERLDFYEGGFDYSLIEVSIQVEGKPQTAKMYVPAANRWTPGAPWSLDDWVAQQGALTMEAATEVMERFGHNSAAEIDGLFPWIRARAWARILAQRSAPTTVRRKPEPSEWQIEATRPGFDGFFRIKSFDLSHQKFDGSQSETVQREAYLAYDAALVLPYDPVQDQVMLVEQFRIGPLWRNDPAPWVLEPIAGMVDAGEEPASAARREAVEEAGLTLGDLKPIAKVYATPGYATDFFHCFLGICDLAGRGGGVGGLEEENEDIRSHVISFDHAMSLVDSGEINVGPLAMMLLWLARHRDELRQQAGVARS